MLLSRNRLAFIHVVLAAVSGSKAPHLVHIVADDIGWNDLGFANPELRTPHIDGLVRGGVRLGRFYAQKECAPSRSSIMTGRLPFKYGYYENPSDDGGVPTNYTMLPEVLRSLGYRTHAIGKWHCGFATANYTPTYRGFDTFLGYWHWGEEYKAHVFPPFYKDAKCRGVDFTNASGTKMEPLKNEGGLQSTAVFLDEFQRVLSHHPAETPLYVYLAFQNAHDPYEFAPASLVGNYPKLADEDRRNFSAIVEDLDNAIGSVVEMLKRHGMWEDTVIWFNSDNGGELPFADQSKCTSECSTTQCCGGAGNNFPLRGGKFTIFEGGIRSHAFVYSEGPWIPAARRGSEWHGFSHVADVFATMAGLAGAEVSKSHGITALGDTVDGRWSTDGFDLWAAIARDGPSPRRELLHQPLNQYWNGSCPEAYLANPFMPSCGASLTVMPYKLIAGFPGDARVVHLGTRGGQMTPRDMCAKRPCLFNVVDDPSEERDLAEESPSVVAKLLHRLHELSTPQAVPQPADALTPDPSDEACAMVERTGAWMPWEDASSKMVVSFV